LIFFNAFKTTEKTETSLNLVQNQIEKIITKEVRLITLNVNTTSSISGCYFINYAYSEDENIITKNSSGYIYKSNHDVSGDKIYIDFLSNRFYYVYFSEDFREHSTSSCNGLLSDYQLGLVRTYNVISMKQINENLSIEYNENYINLKKKIGIPDTKDFALNFYNNTNQANPLKLGNPPEKAIVYARSIPVQFMYEDGNFEYGFMQIKIW
jgi:hypothetical protein